MKSLHTIDVQDWETLVSAEAQNSAAKALEEGKVLYLPHLAFNLSTEEKLFLSPHKADPKKKNISYDIRSDRLAGANCSEEELIQLKAMIKRYAVQSRQLLEKLIPGYKQHLFQGKTSFRPVEIKSRKISARKNDQLLHVDSFPSNPTKGNRILRVFTNINPVGTPRVWRVGESFDNVVRKMAPKASAPIPGVAYLLQLFKITKDLRTPYDHYMLKMHDMMKEDDSYQSTVTNETLQFPPGSTWMVYTDQVSHAAMSGQHVLEQTFHLPVAGLNNPSTAPVKVLERFLNKQLV
jgi:hypothetical protein